LQERPAPAAAGCVVKRDESSGFARRGHEIAGRDPGGAGLHQFTDQ
jgi:hypothetical protein